jgi:hypothetical protein
MSILKVNGLQNANGVELYTCKAWVNFNGTGTVEIRAAGNVSSITDNGTGDYTVNFTNALVDANYSVTAIGTDLVGGGSSSKIRTPSSSSESPTLMTSAAVRIGFGSGGTAYDVNVFTVAIFR